MILGSPEWVAAVERYKSNPELAQRTEVKSGKSLIDLWANFLYNEKLDPDKLDADSILELIFLCEELAKKRGPKVSPYMERLASRRLVIETALDLGVDLIDLRDFWNKKHIIGRGLLDMWQKVYTERYGSTVGTRGEWEMKRRDIKTRLAKARKKDGR